MKIASGTLLPGMTEIGPVGFMRSDGEGKRAVAMGDSWRHSLNVNQLSGWDRLVRDGRLGLWRGWSFYVHSSVRPFTQVSGANEDNGSLRDDVLSGKLKSQLEPTHRLLEH